MLLIPPKTLKNLINTLFCNFIIWVGKVGVNHPFLNSMTNLWNIVFLFNLIC